MQTTTLPTPSPTLSQRVDAFWQRWRYGVLIITVIVHMVYAFLAGPLMLSDGATQNSALFSLLGGHGVATPVVTSLDDLSQVTYQPVTWWPPTKTFALVPFYAVTQDLWWAAMLLEWSGIILLFTANFAVLEALDTLLPPWSRLAVWLFWLLIQAPTVLDTNLYSLALFTLSLALAVWSVRLSRTHWSWAIAIGLAMGMAAMFRYAYYPYIVVLPFMFTVYAWVKKDLRWVRTALLGLLAAAACIGFITIYNSSQLGTTRLAPVYVDDSTRLYVSNLTRFFPFPVSFLQIQRVLGSVFNRLNNPFVASVILWSIASLFLLVWLRWTWRVVWGFWRRQTPRYSQEVLFFFAVGALVLPMTAAMLTLLSLRSAPSGMWTFVEEVRYYAPTWIFGTVAIAAMIGTGARTRWDRLLKGILLMVLAGTVVIGIPARLANWRFLADTRLPIATEIGGRDFVLYDVLTAVKQQQDQVVVAWSDLWDAAKYISQASLQNVPLLIADGEAWDENSRLHTSQPTVMVIVLPSNYEQVTSHGMTIMRRWIDDYKGVSVYQDQDVIIFTIDVLS